MVQQALSELNIRVTYDEIAEVGEYFTRARDGSYPVLLYNEAYINTMVTFVPTDGFWNYLGYSDPVAEALVDKIRTGTIEESNEASQELGAYVLEQAWLAPVAAPESLWASKAGVVVDVASGNSGAPYLVNFQTDQQQNRTRPAAKPTAAGLFTFPGAFRNLTM